MRQPDCPGLFCLNVMIPDDTADSPIYQMWNEDLLKTILEDKTGITIYLRSCKAMLHLLQSLVQQGPLHIIKHWNNANACFRFRSCDVDLHIPGFCNSMYEVVIYVNYLTLEITVLPSKSKALAYPHSSAKQHREQV